MMTSHRPLSKTTSLTLLLWSDGFDEVAASVFAIELRKIGLRVELVGVGRVQASGRHGLVLGADITLSEALELAGRAICVIIPCSAAELRHVDNDPRIARLLAQAGENQALFVVRQRELVNETPLKTLSLAAENVANYGAEDDLIGFAHAVANRLANQLAAQ